MIQPMFTDRFSGSVLYRLFLRGWEAHIRFGKDIGYDSYISVSTCLACLLKNRAEKFDIKYNKMLSYRRETALQGAL